ncbi:hypothetical protein ABDJ41_01330 [Pedobacter sp. ASV1-7]|uniref:hypothetical protein n=1 Tax=Pedobacter sp. ASV1-7 TaxID=3145237 RepID=UPI0032E9236A
MNRRFLQHFMVLLFACVLFGCSSTNNKPLLIDFSADSSSIVFNHIDRVGLNQLKEDDADNSVFKSLVSILEIPTELDTTFKEHNINGKFKLTDSNLIFIPEQPFVKGREYLVITHLNSKFGDISMLLKAELKTGVKPLQKTLIR